MSTSESLSKLDNVSTLPPRLLLISSQYRFTNAAKDCLAVGTIVVPYNFEQHQSSDILQMAVEAATPQSHADQDPVKKSKRDGEKRFGHYSSVACLMEGSDSRLFLCQKISVSPTTSATNPEVRNFFLKLKELIIPGPRARLDFLDARVAQQYDGGLIARNLETLLMIPVATWRDLFGEKIQVCANPPEVRHVGQLYFNTAKLHELLRATRSVKKSSTKELGEYDRIRVVGKGAFGEAVLYQRRDTAALVVIKEINLHELSADERRLAINEVEVLALMHHPNIVAYLDNFEKDGSLFIEMEYVDGGTLAQYLSRQDQRIDEQTVLAIFYQIVSAVRHMHEQNVLHRDLKTANIFLTKQGAVKVGDFGISKKMATNQGGAHTVLGTPYYISPEMCEGQQYDSKSDIWALGCILYEMACLQKTFEGSNLPALVNKIMRGQFAPIRGNYSPGFRQLVRDFLQRDPDFRPSASEVLYDKLPVLLRQFRYQQLDGDEDNMAETFSISQILEMEERSRWSATRPTRSVLYYVRQFENSVELVPVPLPPRARIKEVSVSSTHIIALTTEHLVFTWGEGGKGQLGHGASEKFCSEPKIVEALKSKSVTRVCAGDGFSIFASDNGIVMTCGDGVHGCLGHSNWNTCTSPKLVEALLTVDIAAIACGPHHVVVATSSGGVYSWGKGEGGQLGLGHEDDCCTPQEVTMPHGYFVENVFCGPDATVIMTDQGDLFACGVNTDNRLALSSEQNSHSRSKDKDQNTCSGATTPTRLRCITSRAVDVSISGHHMAILTENGHVITCGRNTEGQLGRTNRRSTRQPVLVRSLEPRTITAVRCASSFTIAATIDNVICVWGTRKVARRKSTIDIDTQEPLNTSEKEDGNEEVAMNDLDTFPNHSSQSQHYGEATKSQPKPDVTEETVRDEQLTPLEILALYASPTRIERGETLALSSLHVHRQRVFIVVDTTCPLPVLDPEQLKERTTKPTQSLLEDKPGGTLVNGESVKVHDGEKGDCSRNTRKTSRTRKDSETYSESRDAMRKDSIKSELSHTSCNESSRTTIVENLEVERKNRHSEEHIKEYEEEIELNDNGNAYKQFCLLM